MDRANHQCFIRLQHSAAAARSRAARLGCVGEGARTAHRRGARPRARSCPGRARAAGRPPQSALGLMAGVTYDTGALVAAERNDRAMWGLHAGFLAEEVVPTVPSPVLAEAWRGGGRQASLSRLLAMSEIEAMSEEQARRVGVLAGKAGHDHMVDVTVVGRRRPPPRRCRDLKRRLHPNDPRRHRRSPPHRARLTRAFPGRQPTPRSVARSVCRSRGRGAARIAPIWARRTRGFHPAPATALRARMTRAFRPLTNTG